MRNLSDRNYIRTALRLMVRCFSARDHKAIRSILLKANQADTKLIPPSAATNQRHSIIMNRYANNPSCGPRDDTFSFDKRPSAVVAYVSFAGSVFFTFPAASALATSDLPLPLF